MPNLHKRRLNEVSIPSSRDRSLVTDEDGMPKCIQKDIQVVVPSRNPGFPTIVTRKKEIGLAATAESYEAMYNPTVAKKILACTLYR